jgi:hypothetical protein
MFREENCGEKSNRRGANLLEEIAIGFFAGTISAIEQKISNLMERQERRVTRYIIISFVFLIGFLYVLNAMAIFISEYIRMGSWSGYGLVGLLLIIMGFIFRK